MFIPGTILHRSSGAARAEEYSPGTTVLSKNPTQRVQRHLERSRPGRPLHTHRQRLPVRPGEITPVEIEILPSSTFFEAASSLRLDVLGRDAAGYPSVQARAEHQP